MIFVHKQQICKGTFVIQIELKRNKIKNLQKVLIALSALPETFIVDLSSAAAAAAAASMIGLKKEQAN